MKFRILSRIRIVAYEKDFYGIVFPAFPRGPGSGACRRALRCGTFGRGRGPEGQNLDMGQDIGPPARDFGIRADGLRVVGELFDLFHQARPPEPDGRHRSEIRLPGADRVRVAEDRRCLRALPTFRPVEFSARRVQAPFFGREHRVSASQIRVYRVPAFPAAADGLRRHLRTFGHGARHGRHVLRELLQTQGFQHPEL